MENVAGISVASCLGEIIAIKSHTAARHLASAYSGSYNDAIWTYCPLTDDKVMEVWWAHNDNLRESALVVRLSRVVYLPRLTDE
jgi:hypothetical protein